MITTLKVCGLLLILAFTGFFSYRAGSDHATSRDEAAKLTVISSAQAGAERQRKLDEESQGLLAQKLSDTETAYEGMERDLPEIELLQAPAAVTTGCAADAHFDDEFVRVWNGGTSDGTGAKQAH